MLKPGQVWVLGSQSCFLMEVFQDGAQQSPVASGCFENEIMELFGHLAFCWF